MRKGGSIFTTVTVRYILSGFLFSLFSFTGHSQKQALIDADNLFKEKRYSEAIVSYRKIYEKKKERPTLLKIADCNFLNENYPQAQKYYAEYFKDSIYENIPQFANYAKSSKLSGKLPLAIRLYQKMFEIAKDENAKAEAELYSYYFEHITYNQLFDLDANNNCITLDASESIDSAAAPINYVWDFGDG